MVMVKQYTFMENNVNKYIIVSKFNMRPQFYRRESREHSSTKRHHRGLSEQNSDSMSIKSNN